MDFTKMLMDQLNNPNTINQLSQKAGAEPDKVQQLAQLGLPLLLTALGRNASTDEGAAALTNALQKHKDKDLGDIQALLSQVDTEDGAKILQHVFADKNERVQNNLAKQTGLGSGQVGSILTQLAPLLMGALGQQQQAQNVGPSGITGLLSGMMDQTGDNAIAGILTNLLDTDNDGSIIDNIAGILGGFLKR